jgi:hypothetical protein
VAEEKADIQIKFSERWRIYAAGFLIVAGSNGGLILDRYILPENPRVYLSPAQIERLRAELRPNAYTSLDAAKLEARVIERNQLIKDDINNKLNEERVKRLNLQYRVDQLERRR